MSENTLPAEPAADATQQQLLQLFDFKRVERTELAPDIFSISGFPHYEDVLSNWYAFFFRTEEVHGFGRLFTQALLELIAEKSAEPLPEGFMGGRVHCRREVQTKGKNYIDLVLYDEENEPNTFNNVIVFENKVYHILNNNLKDYYESMKTSEGGVKTGVVMTLFTYTGKKEPGYIYLTHSEFLSKVFTLFPSYNATSDNKFTFYIKDIDQNIQRLTSEMKMNTNIRFYLENAAKFHAMQEVAREAIEFVYGQIDVAARNLQLEPDGKQYDYRHMWQRGVDHIYYTVLLNDFLKDGRTIHVVLEVWTKKALKLFPEYDTACQDIKTGEHVNRKPVYDGKWDFRYYAWATYSVQPEQMEELGTLLAEWIRRDLEDIRKAVTDVYTKQLNPSA